MGAPGKKRTTRQAIGAKGEHLFAAWATDVGMTANKAVEDVGVDFFCQVLDPDGEVRGELLAVQVRSTASYASRRLELTRDDVAAALRVEGPYCFAGVDVHSRRVGFRFLDDALVSEFIELLRNGGERWGTRFRDLESGSETFRATLARITAPGYQHRLRVVREQEFLRLVVPGSTISVAVTTNGAAPTVELPWLSSAFEVDPSRRGEVLERVLIHGEMPDVGALGLRVREALRPVSRLGDGRGIFITGRLEQAGDLVLIDCEGPLQIPARIRHMDEDFAWATTSGLVVLLGRPIPTEDGEQHPVSFSITEQNATALGAAPDELAFLRRLRPGARLSFADDWDIELWDPLQRIGETIEALELVCSKAGVPLESFKLADLDDPEFGRSLFVLDGIARGSELPEYMGQILVGPAADRGVEPEHGGWYEIPVVANLKDKGVVVWLRGRCLLSYVEHDVAGFLPVTQCAAKWEVRGRLPTEGRPQIWIDSSWPGFDFDEGWGPRRAIDPANHPISGRVWCDRTAASANVRPREWSVEHPTE